MNEQVEDRENEQHVPNDPPFSGRDLPGVDNLQRAQDRLANLPGVDNLQRAQDPVSASWSSPALEALSRFQESQMAPLADSLKRYQEVHMAPMADALERYRESDVAPRIPAATGSRLQALDRTAVDEELLESLADSEREEWERRAEVDQATLATAELLEQTVAVLQRLSQLSAHAAIEAQEAQDEAELRNTTRHRQVMGPTWVAAIAAVIAVIVTALGLML